MRKRIIGIFVSVVMLLAMTSAAAFAETKITDASSANILLVKSSTYKKRAVNLGWNKIPGATKYVVYGNKCGKRYKKIATVRKTNYRVKKIKGKKLQAHKTYKFYVVAYKGGKKICKSQSVHCITAKTKGKYGNVKSIKVAQNTLQINKGENYQLSVKKSIVSGKKHISKSHGAATRYYSSNKSVATVDSKGLITAKDAGSVKIYAQDIGGKYAVVTLTVVRGYGGLTGPIAGSNEGPLCFTLDERTLNNSGTISMSGIGEDKAAELLYSNNGRTWKSFVVDETKVAINRSNPVVYFKAAVPNGAVNANFEITAKKVAASGSVMSLLDPTCQQATIEEEKAFGSLFWGCTALTKAPSLPAVELSDFCYAGMFFGCTGLTEMPELPATIMADYCYNEMFYNCGFISGVKLPATQLAPGCYAYMFAYCDGVSFEGDSSKALPVTTLAENCYMYMFTHTQEVNGLSVLPATTLTANCYKGMYSACPSIVKTPRMTPIYIEKSSCEDMFSNCSNLKTADISLGVLLGIQMKQASCKRMFYGCKNLTTAPKMTIANTDTSCCEGMYEGCSSLVSANHNMGMTTANRCYYAMFKDCINLKYTPTLMATVLSPNCYQYMYKGCTSLVTAASMEAVSLAQSCCEQMYYGCTALTSAPELKSEELVNRCYYDMFRGCKNLRSLRVRFKGSEDDTYIYGCLGGWTTETPAGSIFYCPSDLSQDFVPEGWIRRNV